MTTKSNFGNTLERIVDRNKEEVQNLNNWELQTFTSKLPKLNQKVAVSLYSSKKFIES